MALLGPQAMSELSPKCAPKQTSAALMDFVRARLLRNCFNQRGRCGNQVTIAWFRIGLGDKSDPQFGQSTVLIGLDLAGVGRGLQVRT